MSPSSLPAYLQRLERLALSPQVEFFGPDSVYWRVGRERVLLLGGPAAVLLQLAHPAVAAGVDQHSDFAQDPIGREKRTFEVVYTILFGTTQEALEAVAKTYRLHEEVKGALRETAGKHRRGTRYHANQQDLLLWVYATLVDQALLAYELFVGRLTAEHRRIFYAESKRFAELFGVRPAVLPETLGDFYEYYEETIQRTLAVGAVGMKLKNLLFDLPEYRYLRPISLLCAGGMLPPRVREAYEIPWDAGREALFETFCQAVYRLLPLLPSRLRYVRQYRQARRRLRG